MTKINEYTNDKNIMDEYKADLINAFIAKYNITYEEAEKMYQEVMNTPLSEDMKNCLNSIEKKFKEIENMSDEEIIQKYKERHP